jgi:hypothetical protein
MGESLWLLFNAKKSNFADISRREHFGLDYDGVCSVLDQRAQLDFYSTNSHRNII